VSRNSLSLMLLLIATLWGGTARAEERRYALVIGYNGAPAAAGVDSPPPLRFADDDALAFYELMREQGDDAAVLASPDSDTRRRYPETADAAEPPTLAELDRAMARFESALRDDARAGRKSVFFFFYSGHGIRDADGQPALALMNGSLSRTMLYEHVLHHAPADVVHLLVDACHAESLVSMRDGTAKVVTLTPDDVAAYVSQTTLAPYPNVGIAIASSRDGVSHEWDSYQSGVFTHEVISALRGAADVNGDKRVEYSELDAFLAAANREVQDSRARLQAIVKPPLATPRAPIADLSQGQNVGRLTKITAAPQSFWIEDDAGIRLADGRPELGFSMSISLPANRRLFVRRGDEEAELQLSPGVELDFKNLAFRPLALKPRGALDSSLRHGLFLTQFGPSYYRGYVDRQDVVAVPLASEVDLFAPPPPETPKAKRKSPLTPWLGGAAAAMIVSSGLFGGLAWDAWHDAQGSVERDSLNDARRFRTDTALSVGFLVTGAACATAAFLLHGEH
jgi:hypothetical protein